MAATKDPSSGESRRSPRDRLLDAANELFYAEGVQSVGIDRVIERAGVAKASLYSTYGSKEKLVVAYLEDRHGDTLKQLQAGIDQVQDPRERLLGVFDAQAKIYGAPGYNGCAFISAAAEAPPAGLVMAATESYRRDIRGLFTGLAAEAGVTDPARLAEQLQLIYDGAGLAADLDHNPGVASPTRAAARALIEAALSR
jgi:AcrR family transcriptional regulator